MNMSEGEKDIEQKWTYARAWWHGQVAMQICSQ